MRRGCTIGANTDEASLADQVQRFSFDIALCSTLAFRYKPRTFRDKPKAETNKGGFIYIYMYIYIYIPLKNIVCVGGWMQSTLPGRLINFMARRFMSPYQINAKKLLWTISLLFQYMRIYLQSKTYLCVKAASHPHT